MLDEDFSVGYESRNWSRSDTDFGFSPITLWPDEIRCSFKQKHCSIFWLIENEKRRRPNTNFATFFQTEWNALLTQILRLFLHKIKFTLLWQQKRANTDSHELRFLLHLIRHCFKNFVFKLAIWHLFQHMFENTFLLRQNGLKCIIWLNFFKKFLTNVFHEVLHFFQLIRQFFKILLTNQHIGFYLEANSKNRLLRQQNRLV